MHILIVTPHFYPENFRINDFAKAFIERGHKITVLTATPDYPEGKIYKGYGLFKRSIDSWKGINIYRAPVITRGKGKKLRLFLNYLSFIISGSIYVLFLRRKKIDLIFVYEPSPITIGIPAALIKKLKKIPLIFWVLDLWPESVSAAGNLKTNFFPRLLIPMVKFIYNNCDKILVSSVGFISSIIDKGIKEEKIDYFPQWAEAIYKPVEPGKEFNIELPQGFKVIFAGNIGEAQDFESILEAAELIRDYKDIHWIILGDGRKSDFVKKQVALRKLEGTFHLMGKFPIELMPEFFARADVLFLSLKNEYIFSLTVPAKLQSYLACGRPVLTMLNGEGSNIVNQAGAGLTCGSGDFEALAGNVLKMHSMKKHELEKFGLNGREFYLKYFEREMLLNKIERIFLSIMK